MVTIKNNILWPLKQFVSRNRLGGGGTTIGMTPFYRSPVSSRVVWSGIAGAGVGAEGGVHAWPAYQMMTKVPGRNILLYAWIFLLSRILWIFYTTYHFLQQSRARAENLGSLVPEDVEDDDEHFTAEQMIQFLNNLAKENNKLSVGREVKWGVWYSERRKLKIRLHVLNTTLKCFISILFRVWKYKTQHSLRFRNLNAVSDFLFVAVLIIVIIMGLHCVSYNLQTSSCTAVRVYCVTEHPFP